MAPDDQRMEMGNNSKPFNVHPDQYLRAITQIMLSISVLCIMFFHSSSSSSSSRSSFLFRSIKFYLSAIPLHSLDKRWVFLICNGILAIIANTSGLLNFPFFPSSSWSSSPGFDHNHEYRVGHQDYHHHLYVARPPVQVLLLENADQQVENDLSGNDEGPNEDEQEEEEDGHSNLEEAEEEFEDKQCITAEEEQEEEGHEKQILELAAAVGQQDEEIRIDITRDDRENEDYDHHDGFDRQLLMEKDEQEEETVLERMSTEELNKKFEDFIRKMKEDLRIEAQQQHHHLVVVK